MDATWSGQDGGWRYLAQRFSGDGGGGAFLDTELPLTGAVITDALSGPIGLEGDVSPLTYGHMAVDGYPVLYDWGTAIWAEKDGQIRGGGLLTDSGWDGSKWHLQVDGFTAYPVGQPYTDAWYGVEVDVLDIYRKIWEYLQSKPGGNFGLIVPDTMSGIKVGITKTQNEFDVVQSSQLFESGEIKLAWYMTPDLGATINDLRDLAAFDYHEMHRWDGNQIRHSLELGVPRLGKRRHNLRFVVGENVATIPPIDKDSEDYASDVLVLGAGEGNAMLHKTASSAGMRVRRAQSITKSSLKSDAAVAKYAQTALAQRSGRNDITELVVADSLLAPIGSVGVGDEILIQGDSGGIDLNMWVRVLSYTLAPDNDVNMVLTVIRADKAETT